MDIHQIRYFLAVCETRNFTRAAAKCNVTQPALSRAIRQLEDEFGGILLRRERNLTHLTDLGTLVLPHLRAMITELAAAKADASKFLCLDEAYVKVGIMCTIGPRQFTGLLADLNVRHSGIRLQLLESTSTELRGLLETGEIDVAIMSMSKKFPKRFDATPLYRERFFIALPDGHPLLDSPTIPIRKLDGQNYLVRLNCEFRKHLLQVCRAQGAELQVTIASDNEEWIQNLAAGGLGFCFIPEFVAVIPGLKLRPAIRPEIWRNVCLVTVSGRRFSPAVIAFLRSVRSHNWAKWRTTSNAAAARAA